VAIYRIVQEALTNVARHARATSCRVEIGQGLDAIAVTVADDGVGFAAAAREGGGRSAGLGLIGIRERVEQLSGTVRVTTAPGAGTRLTVQIPAAGSASAPAATLGEQRSAG
jgi:signal transduction histidine kinase